MLVSVFTYVAWGASDNSKIACSATLVHEAYGVRIENTFVAPLDTLRRRIALIGHLPTGPDEKADMSQLEGHARNITWGLALKLEQDMSSGVAHDCVQGYLRSYEKSLLAKNIGNFEGCWKLSSIAINVALAKSGVTLKIAGEADLETFQTFFPPYSIVCEPDLPTVSSSFSSDSDYERILDRVLQEENDARSSQELQKFGSLLIAAEHKPHLTADKEINVDKQIPDFMSMYRAGVAAFNEDLVFDSFPTSMANLMVMPYNKQSLNRYHADTKTAKTNFESFKYNSSVDLPIGENTKK
jgi:hypothetical protein